MKPLDQQAIRNRLANTHGFHFSNIEVVAEIDSTNEALKRSSVSGVEIDGHAIVAELQTAGRGRGGKPWFSPPVGNIYLSIGVNMSITDSLSGFSLAIGVAVAEALQDERVRLKWPNDINFEQRKVGGILIESTANSECIVGIGLNVAMRPLDVTKNAIDQPWTSLEAEAGDKEIDRTSLLIRILEQTSMAIVRFRANRLKSFMKDWERLDAVYGKRVRLSLGSGCKIEGQALGIDAYGAIKIDVGNGPESFVSGELRLI